MACRSPIWSCKAGSLGGHVGIDGVTRPEVDSPRLSMRVAMPLPAIGHLRGLSGVQRIRCCTTTRFPGTVKYVETRWAIKMPRPCLICSDHRKLARAAKLIAAGNSDQAV